MTADTRNMLRHIIAHLCAVGVAAVFLYAAYFKIDEPRQFVIDIRNYHMMPEQLLNLAALFLPWVEVGGALALIFPPTRRAGAILTAALCLMFIVAVSYAGLYKGYNIDCGCFGKQSTQAGLMTIALDVVLLIGTALAVYLPQKRKPQGVAFEVLSTEAG